MEPLAAGGEGQKLGVDEVDLAIEGGRADVEEFADALEGAPVDQLLEQGLVLVGRALSLGRLAGAGEGLTAALAAVALRAGHRLPVPIVAIGMRTDIEAVIRAACDRAADYGLCGIEIGGEPRRLLMTPLFLLRVEYCPQDLQVRRARKPPLWPRM